jgi:hypothetical protein
MATTACWSRPPALRTRSLARSFIEELADRCTATVATSSPQPARASHPFRTIVHHTTCGEQEVLTGIEVNYVFLLIAPLKVQRRQYALCGTLLLHGPRTTLIREWQLRGALMTIREHNIATKPRW